MREIVRILVNKTVIIYQNKDYRLNLWRNLIHNYTHKYIINKIKSYSSWKLNVVDYIIFHYQQTYKATMNHRNIFKNKCLPLIPHRSKIYQHRRLSVGIISKWYKHQMNKHNLILKLHGIYKLCQFRKNHIEYPLTNNNFSAWRKYTQCQRNKIISFIETMKRNRIRKCIRCIINVTKSRILQKNIIVFRNTRKSRMVYITSLQKRKNSAAILIQSYFRMFYVKSIINEVRNKLSSINDIFKIQQINKTKLDDIQHEIEEFKELNENEYIFDQTIIDLDFQPLSNPVYVLFIFIFICLLFFQKPYLWIHITHKC